MYRSTFVLLAVALAATATARDSAPAAALSEADRDILTRIVVDTWSAHVDHEQLDRWLDHVGERAGSVPLPWLESAAAALDLRSVDLALDGLSPLDSATPDAFGAAGGNLVFTPIPPCRLLDTRQPSARSGVIPNNSSRSFYGYISNFQSNQGGDNSNCGLTSVTRPEALAITLVAVNPTGDGFLTAYPFGIDRPLAASLNYTANSIDSTGLIMPINNSISVDEFTIYTWRATHVVADVTGYFSRPQAAALECTTLAGTDLTIAPDDTGYTSSPWCPDTYSAFFGACVSGSPDGSLINAEMQGTVDPRTGCLFRNNGPANINVRANARCCRIPGR